MRRGSLSRRLAFLISLGFAAIWVLSIFVMGLVLRSEQEELFDGELEQMAYLFRPLVTQTLTQDAVDINALNDVISARTGGAANRSLVYQILDSAGNAVIQSPHIGSADLPPARLNSPLRTGLFVTNDTYILHHGSEHKRLCRSGR